MHENRSRPARTVLRHGQVCLAQGFGIKIRVDRQHLVIEDGLGRERRTRRYTRATHGLSRLVVIGSEGYITLDAVRWLSALGIGYLHLDRDCNILASSDNGASGARLRRLQASAAAASTGIEIARFILGKKVDGQAHNLALIADDAESRAVMRAWAERITVAENLDELLEAEREAAGVYWSGWVGLPIDFVKADSLRIPDHWRQVSTRHSPLTDAPRVAITPVNAMLNYLYAILESESRLACLALGLDPSLGIWHADYRARDSLALDLMEAARPDVDQYVLQLLRTRVFTRKDFGETSRGVCRLLPPLAEELADSAAHWRKAIVPHAEHVVRILAATPGSGVDRVSTPLTSENRRRANGKPAKPSRVDKPPVRVCKLCAGPLPGRDRVYCDSCIALPQEARYQTVLGLPDTTATKHDTEMTLDGQRSEQTKKRALHRCKRCGQLEG